LFDAATDGAMSGRSLRDGDLVLMVGFGAGMTAASAIIRWSSKGASQ
jgi:3-oxoacyl-[acyl-carrier-protein] synthase III